jgi:hypothetical protein
MVGRPKTRASSTPASKTVREDGTVVCTRYSKQITQELCERIANGECWHRMANTGRMPSYATLYDWQRKHPEFAEALAQAREMAADLRADRALEVAEKATAATVQADRLHVGALQWRAAKASPRRYGTRSDAHDDVEDAQPARLIIEVRRFEKVTRPDGSVYVREIPQAKSRPRSSRR